MIVGPLQTGDVIDAVAARFHLDPGHLLSSVPTRRRLEAEPRKLLYRLLHDECWLSWGAVADLVGISRASAHHAAGKAHPALLVELRHQLRTPDPERNPA